jgi:hypothetical protein
MSSGKKASAELNGCKPFGGAHVGLYLAMAYLSAHERDTVNKVRAESFIRAVTPRPQMKPAEKGLGAGVKHDEPFQDANGKWYVKTKKGIRRLPNSSGELLPPKTGEATK